MDCNAPMGTLSLMHILGRAPAGPGARALGPGLLRLGTAALAASAALATAQTGPPPDPASPDAPPSVIAPPRPMPGEGQPQLLRDRLARQAFALADRDGDGQLSQEEAAAIPGLPERFGRADANGDGQISEEEFRAADEP